MLLFQDIAVIPILAILPFLALPEMAAGLAEGAPHAAVTERAGWLQALLVLGVVGGIVTAGRFLLRPVFHWIASTRSLELFIATALTLVVGITLATEYAGLSPALVGIKFGVLLLLGRVFGIRLADSLMFAFILAQGGEFAFLLFSFAIQNRVIGSELSHLLVVVIVPSMVLTPLMFIIYERLVRPRFIDCVSPPDDEAIESRPHPVIIAGYGRFGQIVSRLLRADGVASTLLDHDSGQIELTGRFGYKVFYGDASRVQLLQAAGADVVTRETFGSALIMGEEALRLLGYDEARAYRIMRTFRRHDEEGLRKLYEVWGDDQAYGLGVRQNVEQLEKVLRDDSEDVAMHFREAYQFIHDAESRKPADD